ncbi:MAG: beta-ketoacyl synthase N-terminal-like domain-containing protein, partial [Oligoflexales bacterium]
MREVAIVGRSCILPGALDPQSLWNLSTHPKVVFEPCHSENWRADLDRICRKQGLKRINMLGSYVHGFEDLFDPEVFTMPQKFAGVSLDPLLKWVLYSAWESLKEAGGDREEDKKNCALILGNFSFPTSSFSSFYESQWLAQNGLSNQQLNKLGLVQRDASEHLISRFPALLAKASLGLGGQAFSVDAACASSLYAIKSACDLIQNKQAKLVLVGGVHQSDDLFLHMGLSRINALSKQGHCKPFQTDTDGLLPAEGAGFVCLMDLQEAENRGCQIFGLIKGIGISNDGQSHDFLVPRAQGQACAMRQAFEQASCQPEHVTYVECHGTGTLIGDATEIQSLKQVYGSRKDPLFLGSLKGNLGHLISASGIAGLIRITEAIKNAQIPPLPFTENPMIQFEGSPFELPGKVVPWESSKPRLAGLSAFGFGGNNAHLIVEEYQRPVKVEGKKYQKTTLTPSFRTEAVAVVAVKMKIGGYEQTSSLVEALFSQGHSPDHSDLKKCKLKTDKLNFNASDLESSLGQHLLALELCMEARAEIAKLNLGKTGVVVGMGLDPNVCRYGFHLRLDDWATRLEQDEDWLRNSKERVASDMSIEGVLGCMPSMIANRFSKQEDFGGPSYTVSAEEHSGGVALDIALEQLRRGEWDAAFVAAADLANDPIHEGFCKSNNFAGCDGGAVLVLKRFTDAIADGDQVHAVMGLGLGRHSDLLDYSLNPDQGFSMTEKFGHSHAASALIHVAGAVLSLHHKLKPGGDAWTLSHPKQLRVCKVAIENMLGDTWACTLSEDPATSCIEAPTLPKASLEANSRETLEIPYHWPAIHLPPLMSKAVASSLFKGTEELKTESKVLGKSELPLNLNNRILEVHKAFLNQQKKTHQYFLEYRQKSLETLYSVLPKRIITSPEGTSEDLSQSPVMPSPEGTSEDLSQSLVMSSPEGTSEDLSQSPVMPSPEG